MATKALRPYQIEDFAFYIRNLRCLNQSEPATGKTGSICVMCEYVYTREEGGTIWIMPTSLLEKNRQELLEFTNFASEDVWIFNPRPRKADLHKKYAVILTTADSFTRHLETMKGYLRKPFAFNPCDEPHLYYSTFTSKRTQFWLNAVRYVKRVIPMTGTVIRGRLDSSYPFIHMIEPRYYGNVNRFLQEHADYDLMGEIVGWKNFEKLNTILQKHSINRTFRDVYGAENKVFIPVVLSMSERQAEAYEKFHDEAYLILSDDSILTATSEAIVVTRCRQILACPHIYKIHDPDERTPKEDWVFDEILSGQYQCGILFSAIQPEQYHLVEQLEAAGFRVRLINGNVSGDERKQIDEEFRAGKVDWIVASPATASVGFNWQRAEVIVFLSTDYMDDSVAQGYKRGIRGVRETCLPVYFLRYEKSVEYRVLQVVEQKSLLAHQVDSSREPLTGLLYSRQ